MDKLEISWQNVAQLTGKDSNSSLLLEYGYIRLDMAQWESLRYFVIVADALTTTSACRYLRCR